MNPYAIDEIAAMPPSGVTSLTHTAVAIARTCPPSVKIADPTLSLRPSAAIGQATTTCRRPARTGPTCATAIRPRRTARPSTCSGNAMAPGQSSAAQIISIGMLPSARASAAGGTQGAATRLRP
jgi:hypothetical protein